MHDPVQRIDAENDETGKAGEVSLRPLIYGNDFTGGGNMSSIRNFSSHKIPVTACNASTPVQTALSRE